MVFICLWTVYLHVYDLCLSACVCYLYIPACVWPVIAVTCERCMTLSDPV